MDYNIFLLFIIIFSIISIIIILARKIPAVSLLPEDKKGIVNEELKKQHIGTVLSDKVFPFLEKTLRQLRVYILKIDVKVFGLIQYFRNKSSGELDKINKLTYKNFVTISEKKIIKNQNKFKIKKHILEKDNISEKADKEISEKQEHIDEVLLKKHFKINEKKILNIITKNPKNAENYKKLGMLYFKNEDFLDAEAAFREYLKLNPSDNHIKNMVEKIVLKKRKERVN